MHYRDENTNLRSHITTLRWMVGLMALLCAGLWQGWQQAKQDVRIHIPPDLRTGAILHSDQVLPVHVYAFVNTVFQQVNHWENGQTDFGAKLFGVGAYVTPTFRDYLTADMERRGKNGELSERSRIIQPLTGLGFEDRRVAVIGLDAWVVWLDYNIREYVKGLEVKNINVRFPIRVVRYDIDLESNPWGLALDGYYGEGPEILKKSQPLPALPVVSASGVPS